MLKYVLLRKSEISTMLQFGNRVVMLPETIVKVLWRDNKKGYYALLRRFCVVTDDIPCFGDSKWRWEWDKDYVVLCCLVLRQRRKKMCLA